MIATRLRRLKGEVPRLAVSRLHLPPAFVGYRWWHREGVRAHVERLGARAGALRVVHPPAVFRNPLPRNYTDRDALPDTRGWWGYSFHDVPARHSDETLVATLRDCRLVQYEEPPEHRFAGDYVVGLLSRDGRSVEMREVRLRERHGLHLRSSPRVERLERATWIAERVFHNHSHWLTAHVPKLALLRDEGRLDELVLPRRTTPVVEATLRMLGLRSEEIRRVDLDTVLEVGELTVIGSDRFRPELLRSVRGVLGSTPAGAPHRRLYVSRAGAARRRLLNEEEIWAILAPHGFERVRLEELSFEEQIALMGETAVLVAPHGAGLTNMLLCQPGTHVVEIADLGFPNPNFYAVASAMGHPYWLVPATPVGDGHPLERDMVTDAAAFRRAVAPLLA